MLIRQIIDLADSRAESAEAAQKARDATVISVATALEKKEEARRDVSTQRWTPVQRGLALLSGFGVLMAIIAAVVTILVTR
jgi:hypothetical protein